MSISDLDIECELLKCDRMADEFIVDAENHATKYVCRRCISNLHIETERNVINHESVLTTDLSKFRFKERGP